MKFFLQPQRMIRPGRVGKNDENLPPDSHVTKTIHQRNKSSPALTSLSAAGQGLKGAAKRTPFGDLSNIVPGTRPSKDDSTLQTKPSLQPTVKAAHPLNGKSAITLLKPAQRPSGIKANHSNTTSESSLLHPPADNNVIPPQAANSRKTLTKRQTTIFKDDSRLGVVQETEITLQESNNANATDVKEKVIGYSKLENEPQPCLPPPASRRVIDPVKEVQDLQSDTSLPGIDEVNLGSTLSSEPNVNVDIKEVEAFAAKASDVLSSRPPATDNVSSQLAPVLSNSNATAVKETEAQQIPVAKLINPVDGVPPLSPHRTYVQRPVEQEEYWDEEDEENYEEGYVTARSFRSRGENTTSGTTAVLFPQMNARARKEINAAKQLVEATRSPEDVEDESYDTSMVAEYGDEIFEYMRQLELKMLPNAHYMDNQHEIQWSMRSVLMDWLVQVHLRFNLLPETLFLCVNYIDRFLSCKVVSLGKLQLVGATAIFIAAKYEEINCPSVQEIVYMVDGGYSIDEILKAERFMLTMLQFELGWPGPMSFLRRISKADDYDLETRTLAKYFLEVTLMDERFVGSPPSFTAAASHCLARIMLRKGTWSTHHVYYSGYTYSQLKPLINLLLECCDDPRKHHGAVFNKYLDKRYKRASVFVEAEMQRGFQLPDPAAAAFLPQSSTAYFHDNVCYFRM
ncbi:uncharacterized protein Z518_05332 [Rhinocladiella mackenziei CBS 650.93]|uniref:Cyclin N-terminal domain-containing protein n=1 Tax=Rhinocladiella mackenziei CBS 650.93 TaxID=1442369 RepID=A0A0D2IF77_9EURO|nr:uncharacterized protein Z518_05332 [Rhinocladiella mackenziei CBS 650.93]KIX04464.1 hypothetical protein Z518_05332 [Rhinocladiella mackenziei CBS 650.93]